MYVYKMISVPWKPSVAGARFFLSPVRSGLGLCSAGHRPGYWSNLLVPGVTCPVIGRAQPGVAPGRRQRTGPGVIGCPACATETGQHSRGSVAMTFCRPLDRRTTAGQWRSENMGLFPVALMVAAPQALIRVSRRGKFVFLNALIKFSMDCPSMCYWPINVQCPQCLPQCMLYEIGFDLIKWKIEGLLSRTMYFFGQITVFESFWILEWILHWPIDIN